MKKRLEGVFPVEMKSSSGSRPSMNLDNQMEYGMCSAPVEMGCISSGEIKTLKKKF
jgi:hypothetical protein